MTEGDKRNAKYADMIKSGPSEAAKIAFYRKPYSTEVPDLRSIAYERETQEGVTQK